MIKNRLLKGFKWWFEYVEKKSRKEGGIGGVIIGNKKEILFNITAIDDWVNKMKVKNGHEKSNIITSYLNDKIVLVMENVINDKVISVGDVNARIGEERGAQLWKDGKEKNKLER